MDFHPLANLFPLMSGSDFDVLVEDIAINGLRNPIVVYEHSIIDGRNRWRACEAAGVEPTLTEYTGDPGGLLPFVISENLHRRHLNETQRAMVASKLVTTEHGGNTFRDGKDQEAYMPFDRCDIGTAASLLNVSDRLIRQANKVRNYGSDRLADVCEAGDFLLGDAIALAKGKRDGDVYVSETPKETQDEYIAEALADGKKLRRVLNDHVLDDARRNAQSSAPGNFDLIHSNATDFLTEDTQSYDLLITDPPYLSEFDEREFKNFVSEWVPLAMSRIKPTGRAYIFTGAYPKEVYTYLGELLPWPAWQMDNILVWTYRDTMGPAPRMGYKLNWQACFYLYGPEAAPLDCDVLTERFTVQDFNSKDAKFGIRDHAWQKPDTLAEQLIQHSTQEGNTILDPFCGTGTFVAAAARLGRNAVGVEIDPDMIELCKKRGLDFNES